MFRTGCGKNSPAFGSLSSFSADQVEAATRLAPTGADGMGFMLESNTERHLEAVKYIGLALALMELALTPGSVRNWDGGSLSRNN
jgi:hypothetical protein